MILITLGTISYPFNRAVDWLSLLLNNGVISEPVFLQYGTSNVSKILEHPLVSLESTVSSEKLAKLVDDSRLVISHAGQGSTRMLAAKRAHFVLIPRLQRYNEHIDDHQLLFAKSVSSLGVKFCLTLPEVEQAILQPPSQFPGEIFTNPKLTEHLLKSYPPRKKILN